MLQAPSNSILAWSNGQLTHPLSPRLHNTCWHTVWPAPWRDCLLGTREEKWYPGKVLPNNSKFTLLGIRDHIRSGTQDPHTESSSWFGCLCASAFRWEVGKAPVMLVWNLNVDSVMKSVILTSLQAALLRTSDSIWYSEVNVLYWDWKWECTRKAFILTQFSKHGKLINSYLYIDGIGRLPLMFWFMLVISCAL